MLLLPDYYFFTKMLLNPLESALARREALSYPFAHNKLSSLQTRGSPRTQNAGAAASGDIRKYLQDIQ